MLIQQQRVLPASRSDLRGSPNSLMLKLKKSKANQDGCSVILLVAETFKSFGGGACFNLLKSPWAPSLGHGEVGQHLHLSYVLEPHTGSRKT